MFTSPKNIVPATCTPGFDHMSALQGNKPGSTELCAASLRTGGSLEKCDDSEADAAGPQARPAGRARGPWRRQPHGPRGPRNLRPPRARVSQRLQRVPGSRAEKPGRGAPPRAPCSPGLWAASKRPVVTQEAAPGPRAAHSCPCSAHPEGNI